MSLAEGKKIIFLLSDPQINTKNTCENLDPKIPLNGFAK